MRPLFPTKEPLCLQLELGRKYCQEYFVKSWIIAKMTHFSSHFRQNKHEFFAKILDSFVQLYLPPFPPPPPQHNWVPMHSYVRVFCIKYSRRGLLEKFFVLFSAMVNKKSKSKVVQRKRCFFFPNVFKVVANTRIADPDSKYFLSIKFTTVYKKLAI